MNDKLVEEIVRWALHQEGCPQEMMHTHWNAWSPWQRGFYKGVMLMRIEILKELKKEEIKEQSKKCHI